MAETDLTTAQAKALEGTTDSPSDFKYPSLGLSTYDAEGIRERQRLLTMANAIGNRFRVYKDGTATFGVRPGKVENGDSTLSYAGATGQALTDDQTNSIWLSIVSGALALQTGTSGFPDPSTTPHIPLATIAIASTTYAYTDITDFRQLGVFYIPSAATAANLNTLVGGTASSADALHTHARSGLTQQDAQAYRIPLQTCRSNTGLVLDATGGDTLFSIANAGFGVGTLTLKGEEANGTPETETTTLCFEFPVPVEYVASETITVAVEVKVDESGAGSVSTETLEVEAYELAAAGTVGANLAGGGAQDLSGGGDGFQTITSTITDADIAPGDKLLIFVQTILTETTGNAVFAVIGNIEVRLDVKG